MLYSVAFTLLFILLAPVLLFMPKTRGGLRERLGFYGERRFDFPGRGPRIWLHGASAGDLLTLSPMLRELRAVYPDCVLLVSTLTNSGLEMARARLPMADAILRAPYDLPGATRRAARALKPDLLVLEYTELWPNMIRAAQRGGAQVAMTNGRFSPSKLRSYRALFRLLRQPLRQIDLFLMREEAEAERAISLGAPPERISVTGNTKFDGLLPRGSNDNDPEVARKLAALSKAIGAPEGGKLFIAGSTHVGEEELLLEVYGRLLAEHPELRLVLAPRYVERTPKLAAMAREAGYAVRLRSEGALGPGDEPPRVVLLDTIGELSAAYRLATLVFVGGSFTNRGGQNILEPAAQGRPVLFGPNMENFHDSVEVLLGHGGIQVSDPERLYQVASELLAHPRKVEELGQRALEAVLAVRGASARNVARMAAALDGKGRGGRR